VRVTYTAAVEVATRQPLDVDQLSALSEYQPQLGTSQRGWLEVRISLTSSSLANACATALAVASAATGAEAIACEVMTERESADRGGFVPGQRTVPLAWA
jgi:hypothetical protein